MSFASKNVRKFFNTLLTIKRRIISIFYFNSNEGIKRSDISNEWIKNIRLIQKFRRGNSTFFNVKLDNFQRVLLNKTSVLVKKLDTG